MFCQASKLLVEFAGFRIIVHPPVCNRSGLISVESSAKARYLPPYLPRVATLHGVLHQRAPSSIDIPDCRSLFPLGMNLRSAAVSFDLTTLENVHSRYPHAMWLQKHKNIKN